MIKKILFKIILSYKRVCAYPLENLIGLLVICQILDLFLTYHGVSRFGIEREGNPLLRSLMLVYDPKKVLFVVKAFAIMLLWLIRDIHLRSKKEVEFMIPCLHIILFIYVFGAIIPWTFLLLIG